MDDAVPSENGWVLESPELHPGTWLPDSYGRSHIYSVLPLLHSSDF